MLEILLNATKLVFSEDVRKSTAAMLEMIQKSPEWEQDICTLEATIEKYVSEQAALLGGLTQSKMENLGYERSSIESFYTTYHELTRNGFEHACSNDRDSIGIAIAITQEYVSVIVTNRKKGSFALADALKGAKDALIENPRQKRGRGLLLVNDLADTFTPLPSNDGVKAVFFRKAVNFKIDTYEGVTIIETIDGLYNPSFSRRLMSTGLRYAGDEIILNFQRFPAGQSTITHYVTLELDELLLDSGSRIVALQPYSRFAQVNLPKSIVAYSWYTALTKLSRTDIFPIIERDHLDDWGRKMEARCRQRGQP